MTDTPDVPTPEEIEALFTRADGTFLCARWGRPIAPVVFGVDDATLGTVKAAFEAVAELVGHPIAETDPELGANVMMFFVRAWDELPAVPNLDRLIPGLDDLVARLSAAEANQYRVFRFDEDGAIRACFVFVRMDEALSDVPAETLALGQVAQLMVLWSDTAFTDRAPLGQLSDGRVVLRPDVGAVIRAVYDPVLPVVSTEPAHALRLHARITAGRLA
ncbi:hypothetical protein SAMN05444413_101306 [Roseivivax marinus]|uniref:hypothetical protein n=1 Tax=Roseivivax marinus TaxID=1379903 RepID=UPI0008D5ADFF|nr:hypothetical protein [Roseivivax marinus]SEK31168.1 hypothetical protein SAMN05444413_101306 [Roseivivax marinus]